MAECIIARGGGRSDGGSDLPPIVVGYCSIVVAVSDSEGTPISDLSVHCKDGDNWYNYHTNDKGQTLFVTNSGSANITAWNFSINGNYKWIDQQAVTMNIDAPASSSNRVNISLSYLNTFQETGMSSNIYSGCYTGNYKFRASNRVNAFIGGAGGGSGVVSGGGGVYSGGGGSGGAYIANNIEISKDQNYSFYIGSGGSGGWASYDGHTTTYFNGNTGGSTTAFGFTATGGGGGSTTGSGGVGGTGTITGAAGGGTNTNGYNSTISNFGGGGAGARTGGIGTARDKFGGSPYGGNSVLSTYSNRTPVGYGQDGRGPGGGAGANVSNGDYTMRGHTGGPGLLSFTFY